MACIYPTWWMTADQDRDRAFDKKGEHAEGVRDVKGASKLLQTGAGQPLAAGAVRLRGTTVLLLSFQRELLTG